MSRRVAVLPGLAVCLVAVVAGSLSAARASAQADVRTLTLDEALALARKSNKSIAVEKARLAQAQTNLDQAWAVLLPTIAAQGKYTRNYAEFKFMTAMGNLIIQPVKRGRRAARTRLVAVSCHDRRPTSTCCGIRSTLRWRGWREVDSNFWFRASQISVSNLPCLSDSVFAFRQRHPSGFCNLEP